ncbi:MAG: DUF1624 domain-containing protein [Cellulomonas sp.]|nr:DUF1624 domain-containing protein [Cellulomonas sp.]
MKRIVGVDVARGLAVLGMMTAHVGVVPPALWSSTGWLAVADGRSAATFAVLSGVSVALLSGGPQPVAGTDLFQSRVKIGIRAVLLLILGVLLTGLGTPVAVILQSYAAYFLLVLPVLRAAPAVLVGLATLVAVVGPPVCFALGDALDGYDGPFALAVDVLISGTYAAGIWMAYVLTGLAVGRLDLLRGDVRRGLVLAGAGLAVAGYIGGSLAFRAAAGAGPEVLRLLSVEPHADSTFEVVSNTGVALGVLGLCLVVADRWPRVVYPVAATGALALSVFSVHIVAIAALGPQVVHQPDVATHVAFVVIALVVVSGWHAWLGRGPLELLLHGLSTDTAKAVTRTT